MTSERGRKFTVIDGMVLVAATAVGLAAARALCLCRDALYGLDGWSAADLILSCLGIFVGFGLLILRLLRPRPVLRELFRQPGFAACAAAAVAVVGRVGFGCGDIWFLILAYEPDVTSWSIYSHVAAEFSREYAEFGQVIAPPVAAIWLVMALGGRWEPEPSWVDRAGRALGWFWIGSALVFKVNHWGWG